MKSNVQDPLPMYYPAMKVPFIEKAVGIVTMGFGTVLAAKDKLEKASRLPTTNIRDLFYII